MAQRSRKREPPPDARSASETKAEKPPRKQAARAERSQWFAPTQQELTRSQRRDAEIRATLTPLAPGERPAAIVISTVVSVFLALSNLIAFAAGVKIGGGRPAASEIAIFTAVMLACAYGLWRMWHGAVLGFMALLAIIVVLFALLLIEASNLLGLVVALAVIVAAGWLFFKLVRVLSRIQLPRPPGGRRS